MGFFEGTEKSLRLASSGEYENGFNAGLARMCQAVEEMMAWQADFEGYIDSGDWLKQKAGKIDGHLSNFIGSGPKPTCRLIALCHEEG